jgi:predicted glutamine amidotransferase
MCLIIVKENGKELVPNKMISEVWIDNPHGAGIIFKRANSKRYQMIKGLMSEEELNQTIKKLSLSKNDFIAYHLRWATSGNLDAANTHPFIVHQDVGRVSAVKAESTDKTMFVMHNGVIHDLNDKKAKHSDTIRFVSEYMSDLSMNDLFKNATVKSLIEKFIDGSRLFIANNRHGHTMYGNWHEHEGYLISKPYKDATKSSHYKNDLWHNEFKSSFNNSFVSSQESLFQQEVEWCDCCGQTKDSVKYNSNWNCYVCSECRQDYMLS